MGLPKFNKIIDVNSLLDALKQELSREVDGYEASWYFKWANGTPFRPQQWQIAYVLFFFKDTGNHTQGVHFLLLVYWGAFDTRMGQESRGQTGVKELWNILEVII